MLYSSQKAIFVRKVISEQANQPKITSPQVPIVNNNSFENEIFKELENIKASHSISPSLASNPLSVNNLSIVKGSVTPTGNPLRTPSTMVTSTDAGNNNVKTSTLRAIANKKSSIERLKAFEAIKSMIMQGNQELSRNRLDLLYVLLIDMYNKTK